MYIKRFAKICNEFYVTFLCHVFMQRFYITYIFFFFVTLVIRIIANLADAYLVSFFPKFIRVWWKKSVRFSIIYFALNVKTKTGYTGKLCFSISFCSAFFKFWQLLETEVAFYFTLQVRSFSGKFWVILLGVWHNSKVLYIQNILC